MSSQTVLGEIDRSGWPRRDLAAVRLLLLMGWAVAAIGYLGPWVSHPTAALTLSGADMGEFVKFLPGVLDGTLQVTRQAFHLPPLAVSATIALLIGSRRLGYPWLLRALALVLATLISLQLLPPAWSPASLMSAEFRLQIISMGICWLLLASYWLLGHLPLWSVGALSATLSLATVGLAAWELISVKPRIDEVYAVPPAIGWGFSLCMAGLLIVAVGCVILVLRTRARSTAT